MRKILFLLIISLLGNYVNAQVDWCNIQWPASGEFFEGDQLTVYAQVYKTGVTEAEGQGAGISAWIGVNSSNTDPSTWGSSSWKQAVFNDDKGNNDEYMANIGSGLTPGTYYYASRFQKDGIYSYGGYSSGGGGFWNGSTFISGTLVVKEIILDTTLSWVNLQWPSESTINQGSSFDVYAQVYEAGLTDAAGKGEGIDAWIGISATNTNPSTWSNSVWHSASYDSDQSNNDEYKATLGSSLTDGVYYYASRFQLNDGDYYYGGYNSGGGGFWDGTNNVSGVLTVNAVVPDSVIDWANLQWPPDTTINLGESFDIYAQVYDADLTDAAGQGENIEAWIGINSQNSDPSTWTENVWQTASYTNDVGNNDEYSLTAGASLNAGTYYFASRFQLNGGNFYYGGYNSGGGGQWNGTDNISGKLIIINPDGPTVDWCTLASPDTFLMRNYYSFDILSKVYEPGITDKTDQGDSIQVWFGYNFQNSSPSGWSENNWQLMSYKYDENNNDIYQGTLNIGPKSSYTIHADSFYYAVRVQLKNGPYSYGGYSPSGGGIWNGTTNASGKGIIQLDYNNLIRWANIIGPANISIDEGDSVGTSAQGWQWNVTDFEGAAEQIYAWIGVNEENTNPASWDESVWRQASFVQDLGNTDVFSTYIGTGLASGTYYFASRFTKDNIKFAYGAYNEDGGDVWDGVKYVNGVLTVNSPTSIAEDNVPTEYRLYQNYPNPFNPSTVIRYSVPKTSNVKITVYNVTGEVIAELFNGKNSPGIHQINWEASRFTSGIYFIHMNSTNEETGKLFSSTKKTLLLK